MLGRNGGRRVYVNGGDNPGGGDYQFFAGLEKYFERLKKTRATLKYGLSREIPGLEILLASDDLKAVTVWKGSDLRVVASDTAVRNKVEAEINGPSDPEGDTVGEENVQTKTVSGEDRRYEGYSWYKVADGQTAGIANQPPDVGFLPIQDGLGVPASNEQWKTSLSGVEIRTSDDGLFKVVGGRLIKVHDGAYSHAVIVPGGRWVLAAKTNEVSVQVTVRINLLTNKEYLVPIEGYGQRYPVAYVSGLNRVLIVRDDAYSGDYEFAQPEDKDAAPADADPSGMLLVDPATGVTQPIAGEFRPISQQTFRPLQKTSRPNEYWAAIPNEEKNVTEVGIFDMNHFGFRAVMRIPKIKFNSMYMWADEAGGKIYFVYRGHLLALPLPR